MSWQVIQGDCIAEIAGLPRGHFDAIVTDPPYALSFMSREWDSFGDGAGYQSWCQEWATECLRVLKPGGYLVAFGGTRTYHRMACAIEDAGFEIRDSLHWIYGSGFPKSLDVSKAIDKAAGAEREVISERKASDRRGDGTVIGLGHSGNVDITLPATPEAKQWDGYGTALKPAHEPIILARKPFKGTVAANVLKHGTGGINVDGCRVDPGSPVPGGGGWTGTGRHSGWQRESHLTGGATQAHDAGRWPPNILLTHSADCAGDCSPDCPVAEMDRQSGDGPGGAFPARTSPNAVYRYLGEYATPGGRRHMADKGGASRFFPVFRYCAKAPRKERPAADGIAAHPTVKPVALMRWLVRLVTPPGGTVLDPFAGTGTTAEAALLEDFSCVLIERDAGYMQLIDERMRRFATQEEAA